MGTKSLNSEQECFTYEGVEYQVWSISEGSQFDYITWIDGDPEPRTEAFSVGASLNKAMQIVRNRKPEEENMRTKHSAGPWKVDGNSIRSSEPNFIGVCILAGPNEEYDKANAAIIAASPESLEFIEGFIAKIKRGEPISYTDTFVQSAMKHIAKVRGKS